MHLSSPKKFDHTAVNPLMSRLKPHSNGLLHKYIGTAGPGALTSAILPSYAPINHQPVWLDDVIMTRHRKSPLPLRHRRPRVTANVTTRRLGLHTSVLLVT